jgi:tRNA(Arg) A34 adenosine deaminase TadA
MQKAQPTEVTAILGEVDRYLAKSETWYQPGSSEYYARVALSEAAGALRKGNYGIGAVVVVADDKQIAEYRVGNAMVTGLGVIDHAETLGLLAAKGRVLPSVVYPRSLNSHTKALPDGISVYGTLEPCPMCACTITNSGVVNSVSTVVDGNPVVENGKVVRSDGAANVIGSKWRLQPVVWQMIQKGLGTKFSKLTTKDKQLERLSETIFTVTREAVDQQIAERAHGHGGPGSKTLG